LATTTFKNSLKTIT